MDGSTFDDFVGAIQAIAGRRGLVEIVRIDDLHVIAELRGELGKLVLGVDYNHGRRGIGWVPVGPELPADRGCGFWIDRERFHGCEITDAVIRCTFDDLIYIITP